MAALDPTTTPRRPSAPSATGSCANRWIKLEERRPFLIFRQTIVHVRDTRVVRRLAARVSAALSGPLSRVDERDAAMVVLAAGATSTTVLPRGRRRTHKARRRRAARAHRPGGGSLPQVIQAAQRRCAAGGPTDRAG